MQCRQDCISSTALFFALDSDLRYDINIDVELINMLYEVLIWLICMILI